MKLPARQAMRLEGYDYSQNGAYFVTICTEGRKPTLTVGAICDRPHLSLVGKIIEQEISILNTTYDAVTVDKYVIMPNHVHMILLVAAPQGGRSQIAPTVSRVIKQFKGSVTKQVGKTVWQRSYYDRVLRDEAEYIDAWQYTDQNPLHWREDQYHVSDS